MIFDVSIRFHANNHYNEIEKISINYEPMELIVLYISSEQTNWIATIQSQQVDNS